MTHTTLKLSLYSRTIWPSKFFLVLNISVFSGNNDLTMKKCAFTIYSFQYHTHTEISYLLNVQSKKIIFRQTHCTLLCPPGLKNLKITNIFLGLNMDENKQRTILTIHFFLHLQTTLICKNTVMIPAK